MIQAIQLSTPESPEAAFYPSLKNPPSASQPCPMSQKPSPEPSLARRRPPSPTFAATPQKEKD